MQLVVVMAVRKAVSAATITFTATSMTFFFMIHLLSIYDFRLLISNIRLPTSNSRWDREVLEYDSCYDSGTCVQDNLVDQRFGDYVEMM